MDEPIIWIIACIFVVLGLTMLVYLLREKLPNLGNTILTLFSLAVAIGSLYVAIATYQKAIKDSEEQQKSLNASREQLQAMVETAKQEQEIFTQHLQTSKAQLALQQELYRQEAERTSRKPRLAVFIEDTSFNKEKMTSGLAIDKDKRTRLPLRIRNIGSSSLHKPIFLAVTSRKEVGIWFNGVQPNQNEPFRSQLAGSTVLDLLPYSKSKQNWEADLFVGVPSGTTSFDITLDIIAENLDTPFHAVFHITP